MEPMIPEPPPSDVTTDVVDVSELRATFAAEHAASSLAEDRSGDLLASDDTPSLSEPAPDDPTERGPIPEEVRGHDVEARGPSIDSTAPQFATSVAPVALHVPASPPDRDRAAATLGTLAIPLPSSSAGSWALLGASWLVLATGVAAFFAFGPGARATSAPNVASGRSAPRVMEIVGAHRASHDR